MTKEWTDEQLRLEVGQHFMVGFPDTELTPETENYLAEYKIGNIILFQRNVVNNKQLRNLCARIQECVKKNTGHGALIAIDQEGGSVIRLGDDGVNIPGAMAIAAAGGPETARRAGQMTGKQLRAVGVNFDFAPDMDVNCNPDNPVIGVRSYGDTSKQVADYGVEMIRGLQENHVLGCAKHFPGHGDTNMDSHLSLPSVGKSVEELEKMELYPFQRAMDTGVAGIMTAHIIFPALEPEGVPATMSRNIITGLLRQKMGYDGLVVTDCMEMAAIAAYYGTANGAIAALRAGADIVLVSHTAETAKEAILQVEEAVRTGKISADELAVSTERILRVKEEYHIGEITPEYDNTKDLKETSEMMRAAITGFRFSEGKLPDIGENPLFASCYSYRAALVSNVVNRKLSFAEWMKVSYGGESCIFSPDPEDEEIEYVLSLVKGHSGFVVGTYNGHLRAGQRKLLARLSEVDVPVLEVALGLPYDLCDLPDGIAGLAVWEYTQRSAEAVLEILHGNRFPTGRMPVSLKS